MLSLDAPIGASAGSGRSQPYYGSDDFAADVRAAYPTEDHKAKGD
jgi:hypothetical protein